MEVLKKDRSKATSEWEAGTGGEREERSARLFLLALFLLSTERGREVELWVSEEPTIVSL